MEEFKYVKISKKWPWPFEASRVSGKVYLCTRGKKNVKNLTLDEACRAYAELIEVLLAFNPSECSMRFSRSFDRLNHGLELRILVLDPLGYEFKDGNFSPRTPWLKKFMKSGRLPGFNDSFEKMEKLGKVLRKEVK